MAIDQIATLKLLSDLFLSIADQLSKIKGTPKQRFARDVISLFDILNKADLVTSRIISSLIDFHKEKTVGMRVHYLHTAGYELDNFSQTCIEFNRWVNKHDNFSNSLIILAPKTKMTQDDLFAIDKAYEKGGTTYVNLEQVINSLREDLQATRSPDPDRFPTNDSVLEIINRFKEVSTQITRFKKMVQEFASTNLTIEDFF